MGSAKRVEKAGKNLLMVVFFSMAIRKVMRARWHWLRGRAMSRNGKRVWQNVKKNSHEFWKFCIFVKNVLKIKVQVLQILSELFSLCIFFFWKKNSTLHNLSVTINHHHQFASSSSLNFISLYGSSPLSSPSDKSPAMYSLNDRLTESLNYSNVFKAFVWCAMRNCAKG